MSKKTKTYTISIITALASGGLSALLTMGSMDIYSEINQPPLAPPSILFPIVWTILYILMGISSAIVYLNRDINPDAAQAGLITYGINLVLNFFWSIIFFNMQAFLLSFIWLVALWATIILMIIYFGKISKTAAYLQILYLLWVTFAGYLNFMIFLLN